MFKPKGGPQCQSCGVPLEDPPPGPGTEADGSASQWYCANCYQGGQFTEPYITVEQIREQVKAKIREERGNMPEFMLDRFTKNITKLARWQQ